MIVPASSWQSQASIDLGRPDLFTDEDRVYWRKVHALIQETPVEIKINGIWGFIQDTLDNNGGYGGGGMKYMFWFRSDEDLETFKQALAQI
jgi:hypothetical protein